MRLWPALCAALLLTACAGAGSADRTSNVRRGERTAQDDVSARGATDERDRSASGPGSGCPARFGASGPSCAPGDDPGQCNYPEGVCYCGEPRYCGGAAPPPMRVGWQCEPVRPPCPAVGTPCTEPGSCSQEPCGWGAMVSCIGGVWTEHMVPPPP